jgi:hypothetical protein
MSPVRCLGSRAKRTFENVVAIIAPEYIWARIFRYYAWELQITSFCAPQRMDAEIADAMQIGGSVRVRPDLTYHSA